MSLTITLPDEIATKLQAHAEIQQKSVDDIVVNILGSALDDAASSGALEAVVLRIQSHPSDPSHIHPATQDLGELLKDVEREEPLDVAAWQSDWSKVEEEMKAITRANDIVEGRV